MKQNHIMHAKTISITCINVSRVFVNHAWPLPNQTNALRGIIKFVDPWTTMALLLLRLTPLVAAANEAADVATSAREATGDAAAD